MRVAERVRPLDRRHPAAGPLAVVGDQQQRDVGDRGARLDERLDAAAGRRRTRARCCSSARLGGAHRASSRCVPRRRAGRRMRARDPRRKRSNNPMRTSVPGRATSGTVASGRCGRAVTRVQRWAPPGPTRAGCDSEGASVADADFDVVILGGGSGGYACALRAAQLGLSRRPDREGQARRHLPAPRLHPDQGAAARREVADPPASRSSSASRPTLDGIDMAGVNAYKDGVVSRLYKGLQGLIKGRGITVIEGEGRLVGPTHGRGRRRARTPATHVVLATGSYSAVAARPRHRRRAGHHLRARAAARPGARRRRSCSAAA